MSNLWRPIDKFLTSELYQDLVPSFVESATNEFTFTVKTDNAGTSTNTQFAIPTSSSGTYDCIIDWGDGVIEANFTTYNDPRFTHTFPSAGTYTIRISGVFAGIFFNNTGDPLKLISIDQWGVLDSPIISGFFGCQNTLITAKDRPKFLSTTTDMSSLFYNCNAITEIYGLETWSAPNNTRLLNTFLNCYNLNQNISNLISSNVTNVANAIKNCTVMNQDFSNADFSSITNAQSFAAGTNMSTANYDALLNSLGSQSLQNGVLFDFGSAQYTGFSTAGTAHTKLRNQYSWTITDGGASINANTSIWIDAYDETTITESSGSVSQWDDRSGNLNHLTQSTASLQPTTGTNTINNKNVVYFNEDFMGFPASFNADGKTLFFVVNLDDTVTNANADHKGIIGNNGLSNYNNHITLGISSGGNSWYDIFLENNAGVVYPRVIPNVNNATMLAPLIAAIQIDTSSLTMRINQNESQETASVGTTNLRYLGKGYGTYSGNANILTGTIGEVIVIDEVLSSTEIENIESYLNSKWSIY